MDSRYEVGTGLKKVGLGFSVRRRLETAEKRRKKGMWGQQVECHVSTTSGKGIDAGVREQVEVSV